MYDVSLATTILQMVGQLVLVYATMIRPLISWWKYFV
jgi:hypothetical protein